MEDDELLNSVVKWQVAKEPYRAQSVGAIFDKYIEKGLLRHRRQSRLIDLWEELLPPGLAGHCKLVSLLRGVLKIEVESGPYMFEMQNICQELLENIQRNCPAARVDSIKLIAG